MGSVQPDLDEAIRGHGGKVPLSWVRSGPRNYANFGDMASAVVVAAISGREPAPRAFVDPCTRLAAVGTIAQNLRLGAVHLWGTGLDARLRAFGDKRAPFTAAPDTRYVIHAMRGPHSRQVLLDAGIPAPPIYGDGAWFLPRIFPGTVEKKYELGVVLHLSELDGMTLVSGPRHARHDGGEADGVHLISTRHSPDMQGFVAKLDEIRRCRRIVSASFHGLIVAEALGIPCLAFPGAFSGPILWRVLEDRGRIDHRMADFYHGAGADRLGAFGQPCDRQTRWADVIEAVDRLWNPLEPRGLDDFLGAFPVDRRVELSSPHWPVEEAVLDGVPF